MLVYIKEHKKYLFILLLLAVFIMVFIGIDTGKLSHDMGFHVRNIQNLAQELDPLKGQFLAPDISQNIGGNTGYGLYLFYPSLPHLIYAYLYTFFSLFGMDILGSILVTNILLTALSVFLMYHLSYQLSKNKKVAFLSGLIFLLFPYRLSNIFIRFALNESLLFIWIPLILLGLYYLKEHKYKPFFFLFSFGYIGLIYSHLVMTLYFSLFLLPYLYIYKKEIWNKKTIGVVVKSLLFITIMVLPFLVSVLENMGGSYLAYLEDYMTNIPLLESNTLGFSEYLFLNTNDWSVQYFIPLPVLLLMGIGLYKRRNEKNKSRFYSFLLIMGCTCFLLMLPVFPWSQMPRFLQMIQFPWRLMTFLLIILSVFVPTFLKSINVKKTNILFGISIVLVLFCSYPLLSHLWNRSYRVSDESLDIKYAAGNMGEYFPVEYNEKGSSYYYEREQYGVVIINRDGEEEIDVLPSVFPSIQFDIKKAHKTEIEFPRIYYKGYYLRKGSKTYPIERSEDGFIKAIILEDGTYTLTYQMTPVKRMSIYIKYLGLLTLCLYYIYNKVKRN